MKRQMYDRAVKEITMNKVNHPKPPMYDPYREHIERNIKKELMVNKETTPVKTYANERV